MATAAREPGRSPEVVGSRASQRPIAIIAIPDASARQRATELLEQLRWSAVAAESGAHAFARLDENLSQVLLLDSWLPDLNVSEFAAECLRRHPGLDIITLDDIEAGQKTVRHPRRQELLYVLRQALEGTAEASRPTPIHNSEDIEFNAEASAPEWWSSILPEELEAAPTLAPAVVPDADAPGQINHLPEFVGSSAVMAQFTRMIRLVAPRRTPVLIEGPTGTGKELTARAIHRLSPRAHRPMTVLNCAAIPEALLEAELFGHTRGAFTGAVSARVGRVEAAHGGTLFLDEIGEMPVQLQSKLLRFLESGELQRVGENEPLQVDVRVIAATNQELAQRVKEGSFRADLYYRLAVFPIASPPLASHPEDIPQLAQHFLKRHCQTGPAKQLSASAMQRLVAHRWPGNVRELEHTIERAYILADDRQVINQADIVFGGF
jgi:DNA-binding NtrC family response regulator